MPADFLIRPDQVVKKAYYGKYPGDHLPFEEIDQLVASACRQTSSPCVTFSANARP
jgi:hypothetical protein